MRLIALEEHYASRQFLDGPGRTLKERAQSPGSPLANVVERLCDLGDKRISEMDAAKIDMQILSLTAPGVEQLESSESVALARQANDVLADAVGRYPRRFAGFAALPTPQPEAAAAELERTVRTCGFKGAMINGHSRGQYLDNRSFWPILEHAEALNVPIYLHPTYPPRAVIETYYGGFSPMVSETLSGPGWGWHIETAVHVLRMVLGGVFDRFPKLQIVIGHMGEALPFMMQRFQAMPREMTKLQRPVIDYLRENVHYTFSGFNFTPTFLDLFFEVGIERIMFSADYPYGPMDRATSFFEQLPVSPTDKEKIAHLNAERLFGL